jgi:hypothetical protein
LAVTVARTVFVARTVTVAAGSGLAVTVTLAVVFAVTVAVAAGFGAPAVVVSPPAAVPMTPPTNHDTTIAGRMTRFRAHSGRVDSGPAGGAGGWPQRGCGG